MIGQIDKSPQLEFFRNPIRSKISGEHELVRLAGRIDWDKMTAALSVYYSPDKGRRAVPVRKIAGMIILKDIYESTDEGILKQWLENPYFQYFCGEIYQQNELPFNRSELVKFRHRIGEAGMGVIFSTDVLMAIEDMHSGGDVDGIKPISKWDVWHMLRQMLAGK